MIQGIDVSKYQGKIDWQKVLNSGLVQFAICKATEKTTVVDSQFKNNWQGIKDVGLLRGAYHFARTTKSPKEEADHFLNTIGSVTIEDMLVLDIEVSALKGTAFTDWVLGWQEHVEDSVGKMPVIYTGGPFWDAQDGNPTPDVISKLQKYPLWLAAYTNNPDKFVPKVWKDLGWTLWQKSGDVAAPGDTVLHVPGINGVVDKNVFKGTTEELKQIVLNLHAPKKKDAPSPFNI